MSIIFVGQSPSVRNYNSDITAPNTTSFRKLLQWIDSAGLSYFDCKFINACAATDAKEPSEADIVQLRKEILNFMPDTKIVAVGKTAAWALRAAGVQNYLEIPNPTDQSSRLNDELFVRSKIRELRKYVNSYSF